MYHGVNNKETRNVDMILTSMSHNIKANRKKWKFESSWGNTKINQPLLKL